MNQKLSFFFVLSTSALFLYITLHVGLHNIGTLPVEFTDVDRTTEIESIKTSVNFRVVNRAKPRRIIDGFPFFHELDLLEVRLAELEDVVDYVVITECKYSQTGREKRLYFDENKSRYSRWLHKIIHIIIEDKIHVTNWENEFFVRSQVGIRGLKQIHGLADDDLFIISDLDEIIDRNVLMWMKWHDGYGSPVAFSLRWSYYGFFWLNPKDTVLPSAAAIGWLKQIGNNTQKVRTYKTPAWKIGSMGKWAGWHCSWCFPVESYLLKIPNVVELVKYMNSPVLDVNVLTEYRKIGKWIDGSHDGRYTPLNSTFLAPEYAKKNFRYLVTLE